MSQYQIFHSASSTVTVNLKYNYHLTYSTLVDKNGCKYYNLQKGRLYVPRCNLYNFWVQTLRRHPTSPIWAPKCNNTELLLKTHPSSKAFSLYYLLFCEVYLSFLRGVIIVDESGAQRTQDKHPLPYKTFSTGLSSAPQWRKLISGAVSRSFYHGLYLVTIDQSNVSINPEKVTIYSSSAPSWHCKQATKALELLQADTDPWPGGLPINGAISNI